MITVVSGLPRSGTSMMMRMLEAGGISALTDRERVADGDNPHGYYEFERVKLLPDDTGWLDDAEGRAVKVISALLQHLPPDRSYRVLFLRRRMEEVLASQAAMLRHRKAAVGRVEDEKMAALFAKHLAGVEALLGKRPEIEFRYFNYHEIVGKPRESAEAVAGFLSASGRGKGVAGGETDIAAPTGLDVDAMAAAVDPSLYRRRGA